MTFNEHSELQDFYIICPECEYVCTLTAVLRETWEFIDVFTRILAAGHAEAELKVETLQQPLSEIMSLDHPEVFYRQVSDRELDAAGTTNTEREVRWKLQLITERQRYQIPVC